MRNSELLTFDYTQPVNALPHSSYRLYVVNERYRYELFRKYKQEEVYQLPHDLDTLFSPEYRAFTVVGWNIKGQYDEGVDKGEIIQETYRYQKNKEKKKRR